jgi:glycosyltransferase involved in cell wall biosynthesis
MKTVLYLSYTGMTDPLGQSQVLTYLKGLAATAQVKFVLVSFEKEEPYTKLRTHIEQLCQESGIIWHPLPYITKPPVVSTFNNIRRMKKLSAKLHKQYHFSLVHCRSYLPALAGLYLKRSFKIPFLFDMRGFWADERVDGNLWKLSNPVFKTIYQYFKKKEKEFLQEADHVVSLTENARREIKSWAFSSAPSPVSIIPCCVDFELFNPATVTTNQKENALSTLQIPKEASVITYLGSLGTWYMLDEMMAFAKAFRKREPGAYFMILTGEPESMVKEAAIAAGFDTKFLRVKKVQRKEVPIYLSLSKASVFFYKPAFSKKATSPVKQGELMAMGIPIVCNDAIGDTTEIVTKYNAGVVLDKFDEPSYELAVEQLMNGDFNPERIRSGSKKVFSLEEGISSYRDIYNKLINEKG